MKKILICIAFLLCAFHLPVSADGLRENEIINIGVIVNNDNSFEIIASTTKKTIGPTRAFLVFEEDDVNVSSTKIRNALTVGDITTVNRFLGYPYSVTGEVVYGHHLGHKIGFPTANIQVSDERKLLPAIGVYAVKVIIEQEIFNGMLNIGIRPTVSNDGQVSCEVYIFDFNRDLYGKTITINFIDRVRGERKFNDIEELRAQLQKDQEKILKLLKS